MTEAPTTSPKLFCFVLMPFDSQFDDIYKLGIKAACNEAGAYCERVDEQIYTESILEQIYNQISKADVIIADLSNRNENVFYEVGYAHALNKITILLTKNADDIPFDLKHFPHIVYDNKINYLKEELTGRVKYFVQNPTKTEDTQIDIELLVDGVNLSNGGAVLEPKTTYGQMGITLVVHNKSMQLIESGYFKIAIITTSFFNDAQNQGIDISKLPDGGYSFMLPYFDNLFPKSYTSRKLILQGSFSPKGVSISFHEEMIFRVYTYNNYRDFKLAVERKIADNSTTLNK